jgi:uncharacterized protein
MILSKRNVARRAVGGLALAIICTQQTGCAWLDQRLRLAAFRPTPASEADQQKLPSDVQVYFAPAQRSPNEPNDTSDTNDTNDTNDTKESTGASNTLERVSFLYFPAKEAQAPTVLYLHGVFRNALQNQPKIQAIRDSGFNVLALDYRGWGLSTRITPSEESVIADAKVGFDELQKREPRANQRIVYGHSMGGAVATALVSSAEADSARLGGLVLESTFTSVRSLTLQARWYGFIMLPFIGKTFDSAALIGKIKLPIWMMHGGKDTTVPLALGQALAQAAPEGTQLEVFDDAQHSDLHRVDSKRYRGIWRAIGEKISAKR